jgi:SAM-dependent methyltransferase
MHIEEYAQMVLDRILGIGQRQAEPAAERMAQIANSSIRYYNVLLRTKLVSQTNSVVQYGPFAGMRCIPDAGGASILPRLIGSYEAELHDAIYQLAGRGYERVVNIGCGEGYYAVGLARLLPNVHVLALDSAPSAQAFCRSLAERNEVTERVTIMGQCTPAVLRDVARPGTLIFCDCEGGELELLDPVAVPHLAHCDILVEMHDFLQPTISSTLDARFRPTHTTCIIPQTSRDPQAYPILESFSDFERLFALCEFRGGPTPWGLFLSKTQTPLHPGTT